MTTSLLIIGFVWNLLAPLPPGIAINPETKVCGQYFGGDEYGGFALPAPWEIIYDPVIQTDSGSVNWEGSVEAYCQQIRYIYIPGNLGEIYGSHHKSGLYYTIRFTRLAPIVLIIAMIIIAFAMYQKRKRKRKSAIGL